MFCFQAPDFKKVIAFSGKEYLDKEFTDYKIEYNVKGADGKIYDLSAKITTDKYAKIFEKKKKSLTEEEKKTFDDEKKKLKIELEEFAKKTAEKFATFRVQIYCSVISKMLLDIHNKKESKTISFLLNQTNTLHLLPSSDKIELIYGINFKQQTDVSLVNVFLQELNESKRHVTNCVEVKIYNEKFMEDIPKNILDLDSPKKYSNGLVAFAIYGKDYKKLEPILNLFVTFREFIQFHVHSIKTFLHIRMNKKGKEISERLDGCRILDDDIVDTLDAVNFYANFDRKEERLKVFIDETKKINV